MAIITADAATTSPRAPRQRRSTAREAAAQPIHATSVLLSVRSHPKGTPVQSAPNAYFWVMGPKMKPPSVSVTRVRIVRVPCPRGSSAAPRPARRPSSIARNMAAMWGTRTRSGTRP
jgi:hypothetical protein